MPMSALTFRRTLALGLVLIATGLPGLSRSSLPSFVPDFAHRPSRPVPLEGAAGPLSAEQSRAILQRLQRGGEPTDIFSRHLALEEAIVGSPLTTGNAVRLLQDGPATYRAMLGAIAAARDHFPPLQAMGTQVVRVIGSSPEEECSLIYATLLSANGSAETSVRTSPTPSCWALTSGSSCRPCSIATWPCPMPSSWQPGSVAVRPCTCRSGSAACGSTGSDAQDPSVPDHLQRLVTPALQRPGSRPCACTLCRVAWYGATVSSGLTASS
jgi:hypothetical protein